MRGSSYVVSCSVRMMIRKPINDSWLTDKYCYEEKENSKERTSYPIVTHMEYEFTTADLGNDQLAAFRGDLKHLTSLTWKPNIALNAIKFYSA